MPGSGDIWDIGYPDHDPILTPPERVPEDPGRVGEGIWRIWEISRYPTSSYTSLTLPLEGWMWVDEKISRISAITYPSTRPQDTLWEDPERHLGV